MADLTAEPHPTSSLPETLTTESATPQLQRESSLGVLMEEDAQAEDGAGHTHKPSDESLFEQTPYMLEEDDLNLPPGRMHATRVPQRLSGSNSVGSGSGGGGGTEHQVPLQVPPGLPTLLMRRRMQDGYMTPRSRSRSPSLREKATTATTADGNSSISSLEDLGVDQDILYDRAGLVELLDVSESKQKLHNSRDFGNLPPVNERLSEDTLEDVHAFSDVRQFSSNASRVSAGTGQEAVLAPLDELEEEDDLDDDFDGDDDDLPPEERLLSTVIVTNLENISLSDPLADDPLQSGVSRTGESSFSQDAPSAL